MDTQRFFVNKEASSILLDGIIHKEVYLYSYLEKLHAQICACMNTGKSLAQIYLLLTGNGALGGVNIREFSEVFETVDRVQKRSPKVDNQNTPPQVEPHTTFIDSTNVATVNYHAPQLSLQDTIRELLRDKKHQNITLSKFIDLLAAEGISVELIKTQG